MPGKYKGNVKFRNHFFIKKICGNLFAQSREAEQGWNGNVLFRFSGILASREKYLEPAFSGQSFFHVLHSLFSTIHYPGIVLGSRSKTRRTLLVEADRFLLGFDIGGTKCAAVLGRETPSGDGMEILGKTRFPTAEEPEPFSCIERFCAEAEGLLRGKGIARESVAGIGISCGGPLDSRRGVILSPPNLPGWDAVPVVDLLKKRFSLPVFLQNDANACAVAEWKYGAGRGSENMIFLTFGTGMGAGLILNGRLYSGSCDNAGECGHIRLASYGPVGYGKAGSMEGFCSGGGIARLAQMRILEVLQRGERVLWAPNPELVDAKQVADAALNGDPLALDIYRESARHLGQGLAILMDLLNPERIVIGSVFARSEALFREEMEKVIRKEALPLAVSVCRIVPAALGERIGDIACLALAGGMV